MSDNLLEFSGSHDGGVSEGVPPARANRLLAPADTDTVPRMVTALSNSWLWIAIGLVSLWLMSSGG